jgi:hypothetical protein
VRPVEGGVEVDAVRALAPIDKAARAWASISQIGEDGSHPADGASEAAEADDHADGCAYYFADAGDADALCDCGKGEPAPRKPSAPADDGELARLLPGLADILTAMRVAHEAGWEDGPDPDMVQLRRACELLLTERGRHIATIGALAAERDLAEGVNMLSDDAVLRARVAELEAELSAEHVLSDEAFRACIPLRGRVAMHEEKIAELTATPPPHTVAALLASLNAADAEAKAAYLAAAGPRVCDVDALMRAAGKGEGLRAAAEIAKATLTPSPLDGVVAEVCGNGATVAHGASLAAGLSPDDHLELAALVLRAKGGRLRPTTLREQMAMAARVLLAGMLACDAAKGGDT